MRYESYRIFNPCMVSVIYALGNQAPMTRYQIVNEVKRIGIKKGGFKPVHIYGTVKRLDRLRIVVPFEKEKWRTGDTRVTYILSLKGIMVLTTFIYDNAFENLKKGQTKLPKWFAPSILAVFDLYKAFYSWPIFTELQTLKQVLGSDEDLAYILANAFSAVDIFDYESSRITMHLKGYTKTLMSLMTEHEQKKINDEEYSEKIKGLEQEAAFSEGCYQLFSMLSDWGQLKRIPNSSLLKLTEHVANKERKRREEQLKEIDEMEAKLRTTFS